MLVVAGAKRSLVVLLEGPAAAAASVAAATKRTRIERAGYWASQW